MMVEEKKEIFDFLKNCGCCDICCLRFLKARGEDYEDVDVFLQKLGVNREAENIIKRIRKNPCVTCLDLITEKLQDEIIESVVKNEDIQKYDCDKIVIALSLPISLNIRQISMWIALTEKFNTVNKETPPDVPIKEVAKLIISKKICKGLNKAYDQNGITIKIDVNHVDELRTLQAFQTVDQCIFKRGGKFKNSKPKEITRSYLEKYYIPAKISTDEFCKHLPVPPDASSSPLHVQKVTFTGPTIFVAGRYKKLSRELSHSPWVLQGKRVMEDSIQEFIIRSVSPVFGVTENKIIFSSSGREDVDVRCLGDGRPFVLEIPDSRKSLLSTEAAAKIEIEIEKSTKISVQNLQIIHREELSYLKSGEELKRKFYRALCVLKEPVTLEILQKLDLPEGFIIQQVTPIRVLHRRPLHTRPRNVYSLKAFADERNDKVLILDMVTQAGTYIKELVHGDFGRTTPSISLLIKQWIDILALDVTGIDLNWPKNIDNRKAIAGR